MCITDLNIEIQLKYRDLSNCFWCSTIVQVTELKLDSNERTAVQFKIERAYCPANCILPPPYHNSEIRTVAFVCCGLKQKGTFKGLYPHGTRFGMTLFVHMIPKRHFATVQIVPEWVHSSFHSEWNSRSGAKFHSGIMSTENEHRSALKIANRVAISGASGALSGAKTTRARTSIWAFRSYHVNAE